MEETEVNLNFGALLPTVKMLLTDSMACHLKTKNQTNIKKKSQKVVS